MRFVSLMTASLVTSVALAGPVGSSCDGDKAKASAQPTHCEQDKAKKMDCDGGSAQATAITAIALAGPADATCDGDGKAKADKASCDGDAKSKAAKSSDCDEKQAKKKDCDGDSAQATAITAIAVAGPADATCDGDAKAKADKDSCDSDAKAECSKDKGTDKAGHCDDKTAKAAGDAGSCDKASAIVGIAGADAGPDNATCPMSGKPLGAGTKTVSHNGKDIGFCCDKCVGKFAAMDYADKAFVLASMAAPADANPINTIDPISHKKIVAGGPTTTVDGQIIGFASAGDARMFNDWSPKVQSAYVKKVLAGAEWGDAYTLDTCPTSGEKLGTMGAPIVRYFDGREVRFCCDGCIGDFEADPAAGFRAMDAKMIADQMPSYPMTTCLVGGDELGDDAIDMVYRNRLVRFCCKMCAKKFKADPVAYLAKLDKATIAQQRASYPIDTCLAMPDDALDESAPATEIVVAGRLIRLCCEGCEAKVLKNPSKYIAMIDEARKAQHADADTKGTVGHTMGGQ